MQPQFLVFGTIIGTILVMYSIFSIVARMFHKVGPNEVLVVSGGGGIQLVTGGGKIVLPFLHKVQLFSLETMTIDIVTPEVYTFTGVKIIVEETALAKVRNDEVMIRTAIERFLTKNPAEIKEIIKTVIEGHTRCIIGKMKPEEIIRERDKFASYIAESAHDDLSGMGIVLDSLTIKDIRDPQGYLDALAKPEIARVKAQAAIIEGKQQSVAAAGAGGSTDREDESSQIGDIPEQGAAIKRLEAEIASITTRLEALEKFAAERGGGAFPALDFKPMSFGDEKD